MTTHSRGILKSRFETGDRPTGKDFADLIDSSVNLQDATIQSFSSHIDTPGVQLTTVSAEDLYIQGTLTGTLTGGTPNTTTTSAQVVRASAVRSKSPYAMVYCPNATTHTIVGASAYTLLSSTLSSVDLGMLGFTNNGASRVTYTGSTTAKMLVHYSVDATLATGVCAATVIDVNMLCRKNSTAVDETRSVATFSRGVTVNFNKSAIIEMKTDDFIEIAIRVTAFSTYDIMAHTKTIRITPVSWDF